MTNKELIVKLQETVKKYGKLPVYVSDDCSGDWNFDILDGCSIIAEEEDFDNARDAYLTSINVAEHCYKELIQNGWTPQQARQILPLSTKVQTIHTAFESDWAEFISLRANACSGSVHPNMKVIANKIMCLMAKQNA